ncbi:MAG: HDIG domain-containing protein [Syntrophomonadaceae bacterium]|nr:HDIG domain-containing protein [Syntrophomonadaceae bacterium]
MLSFLRSFVKKPKISATGRLVVLYLGFYLLVTLVIFSNFMNTQLALKPGQISPRNIKSPHAAIINDKAKTAELQKDAEAKVRKVYQEDKEALGQAQLDLTGFFNQIKLTQGDENLTTSEKVQRLESFLTGIITDKGLEGYDAIELATYLENSNDSNLEDVSSGALRVLNTIMAQPITEEVLPTISQQIKERSQNLGYLPVARDVVEISVVRALRPNMIFNSIATQEAIEQARAQVLPVQRTIQQGQMIIREGDPVTQSHIDILEQLGIQRSTGFMVTLGGIALLVLMFFAISATYLNMYHTRIFKQGRLMTLYCLIFLLIITVAKGLTMIEIGGMPEVTVMIAYLIPVAAGSMLVAILLDKQLAYFFTFIVAIIVGLFTQGNPIPYVTTAFVSGAVGILWVTRLNQTGDLARSGLFIAGANIVSVLTMSLLFTGLDTGLVITSIFFGALNGFLSAILMIGLLPYLETLFSLTSMVKLLELSNPNQDLLRRLLVEAPGTYHHSIMVGNLAESAAERIGAQALLVRVGAYYHDIGKLKRPYFFVENQLSHENPHEKVAPSLSALIITSHIKDGIEFAQEKRIPPPIVDFIEQHHGDSLVRYFFNRALEEDKVGKVNEETFRYEGPKPQSKEVALVMLADSVEAAVRSLPEPTPGRIEGMVRRIIKEKLNDGQLDECDLTFRDLNIIAESFSQVLAGVFHNRIEYPETLAREFEKGRNDVEDSNNKPTDQL